MREDERAISPLFKQAIENDPKTLKEILLVTLLQ